MPRKLTPATAEDQQKDQTAYQGQAGRELMALQPKDLRISRDALVQVAQFANRWWYLMLLDQRQAIGVEFWDLLRVLRADGRGESTPTRTLRHD